MRAFPLRLALRLPLLFVFGVCVGLRCSRVRGRARRVRRPCVGRVVGPNPPAAQRRPLGRSGAAGRGRARAGVPVAFRSKRRARAVTVVWEMAFWYRGAWVGLYAISWALAHA